MADAADGTPLDAAATEASSTDAVDAREGVSATTEVPEDLTLLSFLARKELVDCSVRLPGGSSGGELSKGRGVPCHKLALCSASGYFFRRFVMEGADGLNPVVELPSLPEDGELRRQIDVSTLFPVVLRFIYSGQRWEAVEAQVTPNNAMGLFALAELLEIKPLASKAFEFLESSVLCPATAARLLYAAVRLRSSSRSGFAGPCTKCAEVLRNNFFEVCSKAEELDLVCQLPIDVLAPILEADDLDVPTEATVLHIVRQLLRARMQRDEAVLSINRVRLCKAGPLLPQLTGAAGGVVWEALLLEEVRVQDPSQLFSARAEATRYVAATQPLQMEESIAGECQVEQELVLNIPLAAVGPGKPGNVVLRARAVSGEKGGAGEVLLAALLPTDSLPPVGPTLLRTEGSDAEAAVHAPGAQAGTLHFTWQLSKATATGEGQAPALAALAIGEAGAGAGAEGESRPAARGAASRPSAAAFSEEEAARVLGAVRFPHLEHGELLTAVRDPVLLEAGAQPRILEALSSRLEAYERASSDRAAPRQEPRPSTCRAKAQAGALCASPSRALAGSSPGHSGTGGLSSSMKRSTAGGGGHPLFPCNVCRSGAMVLRQREGRWCVECSRHPHCDHGALLPSSVVAAAVDGHCAACTLRLQGDVRTLTIKVGHQHAAALLKLPGGVDTLRGMCVAGCCNTLEILGN